jgi:hypothetical protein
MVSKSGTGDETTRLVPDARSLHNNTVTNNHNYRSIESSPPDSSNQHNEGDHARAGQSSGGRKKKEKRADGKVELTEKQGAAVLGTSFSRGRKWWILSAVAAVQVSMNFNAAVYSNAVPLVAEEFGVAEQAARVGQMVFLIAYGLGSELWAPWSEELGRWPVLQLSLLLVNSGFETRG